MTVRSIGGADDLPINDGGGRRIEQPPVIFETESQIVAVKLGNGPDDMDACVRKSVADDICHNLLENEARAVFGVHIELMALEPCAQSVQTFLQAPEIVGHCDGPGTVRCGAANGIVRHDLCSRMTANAARNMRLKGSGGD